MDLAQAELCAEPAAELLYRVDELLPRVAELLSELLPRVAGLLSELLSRVAELLSPDLMGRLPFVQRLSNHPNHHHCFLSEPQVQELVSKCQAHVRLDHSTRPRTPPILGGTVRTIPFSWPPCPDSSNSSASLATPLVV